MKDRAEYKDVHGGHGIGAVNMEGIMVLDTATACQLRILYTIFQKRTNSLITHSSGGNVAAEYTQQTHNVPLTLAEGYVLVTEFRFAYNDIPPS